MTLYNKELARVLKSLVFLLSAFGIVFFLYSQGFLPPDSSIVKPVPGLQSYGMKDSNDPTLIMPEAADALFSEYSANGYVTYPNGCYKYVKLGQSDNEKMSGIISQLNTDVTWERFCALMRRADELLGGGSDYSETWISHRFGQIPVTYEEALADYELSITSDRYSGAHARFFSDYAGIILALLPVFPAVFLCLKDRKSISPMLYTRSVSSSRIIISRYLALVTAIMLPVLLMGAVLTFIHGAEYGFAAIDLFAYLKYTLAWLLPTAMASAAVGFFFTTLTGTPVAIGVQLLWWFVDMLGDGSAYSYYGTRLFKLIPRHNALGETGAYLNYLPSLIQNRICIALFAIILIAITVTILSAKRRGFLHVPVFKHRKIQSEV
jgi:hypothetical protein